VCSTTRRASTGIHIGSDGRSQRGARCPRSSLRGSTSDYTAGTIDGRWRSYRSPPVTPLKMTSQASTAASHSYLDDANRVRDRLVHWIPLLSRIRLLRAGKLILSLHKVQELILRAGTRRLREFYLGSFHMLVWIFLSSCLLHSADTDAGCYCSSPTIRLNKQKCSQERRSRSLSFHSAVGVFDLQSLTLSGQSNGASYKCDDSLIFHRGCTC